MHQLHQLLAERTRIWRKKRYAHDRYPAIAEILEFQQDPSSGALRYLRAPQLRALETYWYLRLVEDTPHILDLCRRHFQRKADLLSALGVPNAAFEVSDYDLDALLDRLRSDDDFVRAHKLDSLHETLTLDYPSYILALAMGAGKAILIGAIIATEFAMAIQYPDGPFIQNALVFAPGKTIIESLRELAETSYEKILPPRLCRADAVGRVLRRRAGEAAREDRAVRASADAAGPGGGEAGAGGAAGGGPRCPRRLPGQGAGGGRVDRRSRTGAAWSTA